MTAKSAPYFWVVCDRAGCTARCPSDGDDYTAWVELSQAHDYARESGWTSRDGRDQCPDHLDGEDA